MKQSGKHWKNIGGYIALMNIDKSIIHARKVAQEKYNESLLCQLSLSDDELDNCIDCAEKYEQLAKWLEELKEYRKLGEFGFLSNLRGKVGDVLYFPYIESLTKEKIISKEEITEIGMYYRTGDGELRSCSEIGDIIFLTQAEAEEVLKGMEGESGRN